MPLLVVPHNTLCCLLTRLQPLHSRLPHLRILQVSSGVQRQSSDRYTGAQAFANVLKRMLEASGRGMWKADEATLQKLRDMYEDMDAQLEGVR